MQSNGVHYLPFKGWGSYYLTSIVSNQDSCPEAHLLRPQFPVHNAMDIAFTHQAVLVRSLNRPENKWHSRPVDGQDLISDLRLFRHKCHVTGDHDAKLPPFQVVRQTVNGVLGALKMLRYYFSHVVPDESHEDRLRRGHRPVQPGGNGVVLLSLAERLPYDLQCRLVAVWIFREGLPFWRPHRGPESLDVSPLEQCRQPRCILLCHIGGRGYEVVAVTGTRDQSASNAELSASVASKRLMRFLHDSSLKDGAIEATPGAFRTGHVRHPRRQVGVFSHAATRLRQECRTLVAVVEEEADDSKSLVGIVRAEAVVIPTPDGRILPLVRDICHDGQLLKQGVYLCEPAALQQLCEVILLSRDFILNPLAGKEREAASATYQLVAVNAVSKEWKRHGAHVDDGRHKHVRAQGPVLAYELQVLRLDARR